MSARPLRRFSPSTGSTVGHLMPLVRAPEPGGRLWVGGGALVAGFAALAFALLSSRSLGLEGFAPIAQMWTVWSISAATTTFSSQQVAASAYDRGDTRLGLGAMLPAVALSLLVTGVTWTFRADLFYSDSAWWPIGCAVLPFGSYLTGLARGRLAAQGSTRGLAAVVGGENVVRALLATLFLLTGASIQWFALAIFAGFLVAGAGRVASHPHRSYAVSPRSVRTAWAGSLAGLSAHSLLVLAPPSLALAGSSSGAVSGVFLLLALYRAPYQLLLGVAPYLASRFSRASLPAGGGGLPLPFRKLVLVAGALAVVVGVMAVAIGDRWLTGLIGASGYLGPVDHGLAAALTVLVSAALVGTMMHLAAAGHRVVIAAWLAPVSAVFLLLGLAHVHSATTVLAALVLAAAAILGLVTLGLPRGRSEAVKPSGSR